jgi:hypothetical protein
MNNIETEFQAFWYRFMARFKWKLAKVLRSLSVFPYGKTQKHFNTFYITFLYLGAELSKRAHFVPNRAQTT